MSVNAKLYVIFIRLHVPVIVLLSAPVGAVLAGSSEFIEKSSRVKQGFGGAMRQSEVLAAMCRHSLENHAERLAQDHMLVKWLRNEVSTFVKLKGVFPVNTNIVIFDLADTAPVVSDVVDTL